MCPLCGGKNRNFRRLCSIDCPAGGNCFSCLSGCEPGYSSQRAGRRFGPKNLSADSPAIGRRLGFSRATVSNPVLRRLDCGEADCACLQSSFVISTISKTSLTLSHRRVCVSDYHREPAKLDLLLCIINNRT